MTQYYKIISRKNFIEQGYIPNYENASDFEDRNYDVPLNGISNHIFENLSVGNYVGIMLKSKKTSKCETFIETPHIDERNKQEPLLNICINLNILEEHFYPIAKIQNLKIHLGSQIFLNMDENSNPMILFHALSIQNFNMTHKVETFILKKTSVIGMIFSPEKITKIKYKLVGKNIQKHKEMKTKYSFIKETFSAFGIERKLINGTLTKDDFPFEKDITLYNMILQDDNEYGFDMTEYFIKFYEFISNNFAKLVEIFGEEFIEAQGNIDKYYAQIDNLHKECMEVLPEQVELVATHGYYKQAHLSKYDGEYNKDEHISQTNITKINYDQIYRVIGLDEKYYMKFTSKISDWGGQILPEEIRSMIGTGDFVRVPIYTKKDDKEKIFALPYFLIIKKNIRNKSFGNGE